MSNKYINSWAESRDTFIQQLNLNIYQLNTRYPEHIVNIIQILNNACDITRVVDVGCGSGFLCPIIQRHFPSVQYIGYDYSIHAIDIATQQWGPYFSLKNYKDLQQLDFQNGDIIIENALADILPNGDECIEFLLSLNQQKVLLSRVRTTEKDSFFDIYQAYNITTYSYSHNITNLIDIFNKYNYNYTTYPIFNGDMYNILLEKK